MKFLDYKTVQRTVHTPWQIVGGVLLGLQCLILAGNIFMALLAAHVELSPWFQLFNWWMVISLILGVTALLYGFLLPPKSLLAFWLGILGFLNLFLWMFVPGFAHA